MYIFVIMIYFVISVLCISDLRNNYDMDKDWFKIPIFYKLGILAIMPVFYLLINVFIGFLDTE